MAVGRVKVRKNGAWQDATVKVYKSGAWQEAKIYQRKDGTWIDRSTQTYTKTWTSTWTQTYRESGTKRTDYRAEKICQGEYLSDPWGIMRSLIGFNSSAIQTELSGATISKVQLYLKNEHWYYVAGGTVYIGYHNHSSKPTTFSHSAYGKKTEKYTARGQGKWITLPNALAEGIRDGKYKGISVFANSGSGSYYGIFSGANDGSNAPKLKITYKK